MITELRLHRSAHLTDFLREDSLFEFRHHLALREETEIATTLTRGALREFLSQSTEIFTCEHALTEFFSLGQERVITCGRELVALHHDLETLDVQCGRDFTLCERCHHRPHFAEERLQLFIRTSHRRLQHRVRFHQCVERGRICGTLLSKVSHLFVQHGEFCGILFNRCGDFFIAHSHLREDHLFQQTLFDQALFEHILCAFGTCGMRLEEFVHLLAGFLFDGGHFSGTISVIDLDASLFSGLANHIFHHEGLHRHTTEILLHLRQLFRGNRLAILSRRQNQHFIHLLIEFGPRHLSVTHRSDHIRILRRRRQCHDIALHTRELCRLFQRHIGLLSRFDFRLIAASHKSRCRSENCRTQKHLFLHSNLTPLIQGIVSYLSSQAKLALHYNIATKKMHPFSIGKSTPRKHKDTS